MKNEDRLLADLEGEPRDNESNGELRARAKREHELKQKKILVACFLYVLLGLGFMFYGALMLQHADEVRQMIVGAIVIIIGFEITVLVKLGYGNAWSMIRTLLAVKEVQLDLCERTANSETNDGQGRATGDVR